MCDIYQFDWWVGSLADPSIAKEQDLENVIAPLVFERRRLLPDLRTRQPATAEVWGGMGGDKTSV